MPERKWISDIYTKVIQLDALISVYIVSLFSAFLVKPYIWLIIGLFYSGYGMYSLAKNRYRNQGVVAIAIFANGLFIALGQYLERFFPIVSIFTNLLGVIASFLLMVVFYYWKEGQKKQEIIIRQTKVVEVVKVSFATRIKTVFKKLNEMQKFKKAHTVSPLFTLKYAFIKFLHPDLDVTENKAIVL